MKILGLVLSFVLLVTTLAFAGVTAKVIGVTVADRDYIWIKIEYNIDGNKVVNSYPMDFKNAVGKTPAEIINWIKVNIEYQCDRYIEAEFRKKVNQTIIADKLKTLVGKTYTKETAELLFDTNNDNIPDKKWTAKTDGTYVEENITP